MHTRDQSAWGTDGCGKERNIKSCHVQRPIIVFAEAFHGIVHSFVTMLLLRPCDRLIYLDGFVFGSSSICLPPVCCDSRPATVVRVAGNKLGFAQQYQIKAMNQTIMLGSFQNLQRIIQMTKQSLVAINNSTSHTGRKVAQAPHERPNKL